MPTRLQWRWTLLRGLPAADLRTGVALGNLGEAETHLGDHASALGHLREAIRIVNRVKIDYYLPYLFGTQGWVLIRKPAELPRELPLLYARLTG